MSYTRISSARSGLGDTVLDKRPPGTPDLIKLKALVKDKLISSFGAYPAALTRGVPVPKLGFEQAQEVLLYFTSISNIIVSDAMKRRPQYAVQDAYAELTSHVMPSTSADLSRQVADWKLHNDLVVAAKSKFDSDGGSWNFRSLTGGTYDGKYMAPDMVAQLFDIIGTFCIEMDHALWVDFNVESVIDRAYWAVAGTISAAVKGAIGAAKGTWNAINLLVKVVKYGLVAGVVGLGVWGVLKIRKQF